MAQDGPKLAPPPTATELPAEPNLFPEATGRTPAADFSGATTAPTSAFGEPDFTRTNRLDRPATDFTTGGAALPAATGGTGATGGTATAPSSTTTSGFAPGPFSSPASTTPTTPNGTAAPASVFGTTALGNPTGFGAGAGTGTAGLGGANTRTPSPSTENSFTLPGAYGQAPVTFSAGQGRLARPRFVVTANFQVGYDDNILQTPTATQGIPATVQRVQTEPAIPERTEVVRVSSGTSGLGVNQKPQFRIRVIPAQEAKFEDVVVSPAIAAEERVGSIVARTGVGFEMQLSTRKTIFTLDANANAAYFFDRPNDKDDLNGSLAFVFAHRFTPRLQVSTSANVAYLSQADVRAINGPTRNVGDYLTLNSKTDLSYRWSKRISTVTSFSINSQVYENEIQKINDNYILTLGTEGRYLYSRRLTLVLEGRYSQSFYPEAELRNSKTIYLLVGGDIALSSRLSSTFRIGEALRSFEDGANTSSGTQSAPYLEASTAYRYSDRGTLGWNTRFGFEEPQDANSEVLVFRTNLSAVHLFTSRLRGSISAGYIYRVTSNTTGDFEDITGNTYTLDLGIDYAVTKQLSLNASYSFVLDTSNLGNSDYYRNQIFFGAQYTF